MAPTQHRLCRLCEDAVRWASAISHRQLPTSFSDAGTHNEMQPFFPCGEISLNKNTARRHVGPPREGFTTRRKLIVSFEFYLCLWWRQGGAIGKWFDIMSDLWDTFKVQSCDRSIDRGIILCSWEFPELAMKSKQFVKTNKSIHKKEHRLIQFVKWKHEHLGMVFLSPISYRQSEQLY